MATPNRPRKTRRWDFGGNARFARLNRDDSSELQVPVAHRLTRRTQVVVVKPPVQPRLLKR